MMFTRSGTDIALENVQNWPGDEKDGAQYANKEAFAQFLAKYRASLGADGSDCEDVLEYYTPVARKLMVQLNRPFEQTDDGKFWSLVEAYHALLLAKDYFGLQRAMGGAFFSKGYFNDLAEFASFSKVNGAGEQLLLMALNLMPQSGSTYYQKINSEKSLLLDLDNMRQEILDTGLNHLPPNPGKGLIWFKNMTTYLNLLSQVDQHISDLILMNLESRTRAKQLEYYLTIVAIIAVLVLCPPITCWYAIKSRTLMHKIDTFVQKLTKQTNELKIQKARTDLLLYQLMPKSIALELKQNKIVVPEHYGEATVYFSDIQGFTSLATKSSAMEVIEFLNQLYTTCDRILDQNDVYKVETIGDAYMVVSGVPKRNGKNHSAEMASAALNILMAMEDFYIPHMPDQRLLMRIGIHTGPVAAGVVGNKMPRYCLFGDTVTTASKMEATSQALRIHISPWTNDHLKKWHPEIFETVERGLVDIKTKGSITTYWLLGKQGLPFRVDLNNTEEVLAKTTYWKL